MPAHLLRPVHSWLTSRIPHCDEKRDYEERNPDTVRTHRFLGGPAVDCSLIYAEPGSALPTADPSLLALSSQHTDRSPPPTPIARLDVYFLYHMQLTFRRAIPRTLDPSLPLSRTSTSHAHLLQDPKISLPKIRAAVCQASHPAVPIPWLPCCSCALHDYP